MSEDFAFPAADKKFSLERARISAYVEQLLSPVPADLQGILANAMNDESIPPLQVSPMDARHLQLLSTIVQPQKILEIGTLFGFSAYFLSLGLAPGGRLYTIEIDERLAGIAKDNLRSLGKAGVVEVITGDACERLVQLEANGPFDIVFIDGDKVSYPHYLKWAAKNLRSGGLLIADNTFAWGYIADPECPEEIRAEVVALRKFNYVIAHSPMFLTTVLPTAEGLTVAVRR
ncbi:O-methyltransferase [Pseudomonas sp. FP2196]|uniref:O-methyltransferase n=1 Tax=Pseudomonas fluorescens TaxID=294 RepID=A0A423MAK1_PSEFL|nr:MULTISPECIES: O-methyltransferase [Pseudomonas]RON79785.1 hypothetical protein BK670_20010 [Pseudomonas fluorescens]WLH37111.1 O-methyltransferase [Pseudomonas sp. FP2196]